MKIYRTVRLNPFQPFDDVTKFPKLLVAFHSDEADFDDANNTISPEPHNCSTPGCSLQFEGLSFYESLQWHTQTNGLNCVTMDDLIALNPGDYSLDIPPTEDNLKEIERIVATSNKKLKKLKLVKKIMVYVCYEYEFVPHPNWTLQHHDYHCTLSPTQTLSCEFTRIKDQMYAYLPDLLQSEWRPHCIKLKAVSEPPPFESSFDRDLWSSCRVIFEYMGGINDFVTLTILCNILDIAHENSYSSVILLRNTESLAGTIIPALSLLMEEIEDYSDTRPLSWLLQIVQTNISLKNSQTVTVGMFGEELIEEEG